MTRAQAWYKANAMVVRLVLVDEDNANAAVPGASVSCIVVDEDGTTQLAGVAWPLAMTATAPGGNDYRVTVPHTHQGGEDGERYRAQITADVGGERAFFDVRVTGVRRES